jgi:hypothetical protein
MQMSASYLFYGPADFRRIAEVAPVDKPHSREGNFFIGLIWTLGIETACAVILILAIIAWEHFYLTAVLHQFFHTHF